MAVRDMSENPRVDPENLRGLCHAVFAAVGINNTDAALMADTLIEADMTGMHSHGVMRMPSYVERLTTRGVDPKGVPSIVRQRGGCMVVDGGNSMGQIGVHFAMRQVIDKARENGVAFAAIRGSNHCGAMAYYARMALEEDLIGVATTHSVPIMPPAGGAERLIGNNPLTIGLPTARQPHLVFDGAFSVSAYGKIKIYAQEGKELPPGWGFDAEGRPTTDPETVMGGMLAPLGGHKGAALGMIMGLLPALLSGASYGREMIAGGKSALAGEDSQFVGAIAVDAFEEVDRFKERVAMAVDEIRACKPAPGSGRVYSPGELEWIKRQEYTSEGIALNRVTLNDLVESAVGLGVNAASYGLDAHY
jgi:LDH2 family malate/lactate/ureidoglycolate dehydrogenase